MQYNYGYKSRDYLTVRPHLTVLKEKGKSLKAIPAAARRAMAAATVDLTATTIMRGTVCLTVRTNCAKCLMKLSGLVQQP